jgi:hypothetical protein
MIILKYVLKKQDGKLWAGLIWVGIRKKEAKYFENDGEFLFCKVRCISGLAKEVLDFQEGLFPTWLFNYSVS